MNSRLYEHIDDIEIANDDDTAAGRASSGAGDGHAETRGPDVHAAAFLEVNKPQSIVLYEVVKGFLTGSTPDVGEMHHVEK